MIPILVDCTRPGANKTYLDTYQVRGFPTLLFVGSEGESLGMVERRDAATLIQHIDRLSQSSGRSLWPALAAFVAIAIAVVGTLVWVYKKWFASQVE